VLQTLGSIFNTLFANPILNVLVLISDFLRSFGIMGSFGFAIISVTVIIRAALHPFFQKQIKTAQVMKDLKPKLDVLQKKYKKDPQKLQKEQLALYQKEGINPASGCLFAVVQIPLIYGLFQVLQFILENDKDGTLVSRINERLYHPGLFIQSIDPNFFVYNLGLSPQLGATWYYYAIPVITSGLQFLQSKVTLSQNPMTDVSAISQTEEEKKNGKKKESSTSEEFQKAMNTQMKYFFPVMIGYFSFSLPIGISLYWNTFSIFSIVQHYISKNKADKLKKV